MPFTIGGGDDLAVKYVLLGGSARWAMINSLWAALEVGHERPDHIDVVSHAVHKDLIVGTLPALKALAEGYGLNPSVSHMTVSEDMRQAKERLGKLFAEAREAGRVILDITPARKTLAVAALTAAREVGVHRILYLYLKRLEAGDRPYPTIARTMTELYEVEV